MYAPCTGPVPKRDVLRGRAGELVPQAVARDTPHARVAERVERVRVREDGGIVMEWVYVYGHQGPCGEPRPVVQRDVLEGQPSHGHYAPAVHKRRR